MKIPETSGPFHALRSSRILALIGTSLIILLTLPVASAQAVLVGAGDIAKKCKPGTAKQGDAEKTARLLDRIVNKYEAKDADIAVFTLGDHAYRKGSLQRFKDCYDPTWGRHLDITYPAAGNHDYLSGNKDGAGYFDYFQERAGPRGKGYYSYELGDWHIIVLNSQICVEPKRGGCEPGSEQYEWLLKDLEDHPAKCTLAYFHHPIFSSGHHAEKKGILRMWPVFTALYDARVEVVLSGHEHHYERYLPQKPVLREVRNKKDYRRAATVDEEFGIVQFVVGTGGRELRTDFKPKPEASAVRAGGLAKPIDQVERGDFGVLKLTLRPDGYDYQFIPVDGGTFKDPKDGTGSGKCHGPPPRIQ